jgi:hypothetical protein
MIEIFHGTNQESHDAFQAWRQAHPNGYNLTQKSQTSFVAHWSQDKRENSAGRGCIHQGGSVNGFLEDKGGCYTTARKVCSDSLAELLEWANRINATVKRCAHCDTRKFSFRV